ncbi:MAG: alanine--tRNA ligase-related protein, partial [Thermoanaerobaculia bacterium]|nr:alanine--tRNA ligase-related protein [Thermoanaerobaculia bacterium]
ILRRAVRHGMHLGFEEPFLPRLVPVLEEVMGTAYPELAETREANQATVRAEEEKFLSTVAVASTQVQEAIDESRAAGRRELAGEAVFRFYDTYGLPLELIEEIAEEEQFTVDRKGFEQALEEQRARSRSAGAESQLVMRAVGDVVEQVGRAKEIARTEFEGYDALELTGVDVLLLVSVDEGGSSAGARRASALATGDEGYVVLDRTPFYAESGGQVGDRGILAWDGGRAEVLDTQKTRAGIYLHRVRVAEGTLEAGAALTARVDAALRRPTERNHTATHLLHAALRHVLGESVRQAGSLVAPDRLRFDFTFSRPLEDEEIEAIEELVNRWVLEAEPTEIVADRPFDEAVDAGAMALFGEKYGDRVRTVGVPPLDLDGVSVTGSDGDAAGDRVESLELCGGCHVSNTGAIGPFRIVSERGVASGVRRIEALTGEGALERVRRDRQVLDAAAAALEVDRDQLPAEIGRLEERLRDLESELSDLRLRMVAGKGSDEDRATDVDGVRVLSKEVPPAPAAELRTMADVLRSRLGSGVVVLGSRQDDKASLVIAVTEDLSDRLHAGRLAKQIAERVDGNGGGRADFAQAGGRSPEKLEEALAGVSEIVRTLLEARGDA